MGTMELEVKDQLEKSEEWREGKIEKRKMRTAKKSVKREEKVVRRDVLPGEKSEKKHEVSEMRGEAKRGKSAAGIVRNVEEIAKKCARKSEASAKSRAKIAVPKEKKAVASVEENKLF
jgi:hypothetical protein